MQQAEFEGGEMDDFAFTSHLVRRWVDTQVADFDQAVSSNREFYASQKGADAGEQLTIAIRFVEIIVGAKFESDDAVGFVPRAGHNDRKVVKTGVAASGFAKLEGQRARETAVNNK